jgi:anaerobic selenocysteine-containing dehydrogenase
MDECEIHARLVLAVSGLHGTAGPDAVDDMALQAALTRATADPASPLHGDDPARLAGLLTGSTGPLRRLDMMLRLGPYGDQFGAVHQFGSYEDRPGPYDDQPAPYDGRPGPGSSHRPGPGGSRAEAEALTLDRLLSAPHGIDLGPLRPRLPDVLRTRSGGIELLPDPIAAELPRLREALTRRPAALVLVGRRHLRSNNSWLHNVPPLTGGSNRCTLQVHPEDAARLGLADGGRARVTADGGSVDVPVEVTDAVRTGVVSLPHGWGHDRPGTRLSVASAAPGANVNQLLDGRLLDPLSGTAVLNGFPVELAPLD